MSNDPPLPDPDPQMPDPAAPGSPPASLDAESVELLSRYARGDDTALGQLIDKHGPQMKRYVAAKLPGDLKRRIDASDIYQQMSIELFRIRERFENQGAGAFRAMLRTMSDFILMRAVEKERSQKRDPKREKNLRAPDVSDRGDPLDALAADVSTPSGVLSRQEHREQLVAAFERLSADDRAVIEAIDYRNMTYEQASTELNASEDALRKRHSRAIKKLRELMR